MSLKLLKERGDWYSPDRPYYIIIYPNKPRDEDECETYVVEGSSFDANNGLEGLCDQLIDSEIIDYYAIYLYDGDKPWISETEKAEFLKEFKDWFDGSTYEGVAGTHICVTTDSDDGGRAHGARNTSAFNTDKLAVVLQDDATGLSQVSAHETLHTITSASFEELKDMYDDYDTETYSSHYMGRFYTVSCGSSCAGVSSPLLGSYTDEEYYKKTDCRNDRDHYRWTRSTEITPCTEKSASLVADRDF